MQTGRDEFTTGLGTGDDEFHTLAHALTTTIGDLPEELHQLLTREGDERDLILERCHTEHILIGDITLGEIGTDTTHIIDGEVGLFVVIA